MQTRYRSAPYRLTPTLPQVMAERGRLESDLGISHRLSPHVADGCDDRVDAALHGDGGTESLHLLTFRMSLAAPAGTRVAKSRCRRSHRTEPRHRCGIHRREDGPRMFVHQRQYVIRRTAAPMGVPAADAQAPVNWLEKVAGGARGLAGHATKSRGGSASVAGRSGRIVGFSGLQMVNGTDGTSGNSVFASDASTSASGTAPGADMQTHGPAGRRVWLRPAGSSGILASETQQGPDISQ